MDGMKQTAKETRRNETGVAIDKSKSVESMVLDEAIHDHKATVSVETYALQLAGRLIKRIRSKKKKNSKNSDRAFLEDIFDLYDTDSSGYIKVIK